MRKLSRGGGGRTAWFQWRLGTLLVFVTLTGTLLGWLGPRVYRSLRVPAAPRIPSTFRSEFPAGMDDEVPAWYVEPAETPLN